MKNCEASIFWMTYSTFTFSCMSWNSLSGRIYPWTYDFYIVAFVNSFFYWWSFSKVNLFFEMLVFLVKQFWYCFIYYSNYSLSISSFTYDFFCCILLLYVSVYIPVILFLYGKKCLSVSILKFLFEHIFSFFNYFSWTKDISLYYFFELF